MADDPENQKIFAEDVAAAAAAGGDQGFVNIENDGNPNGNNGDFNMPNVDEIWKLVQKMEDISDEEREEIRRNLFNPQEGSTEEFLKRMGQQGVEGHSNREYLIFFVMLAIILLVFALFGFKLYKSLTEKELKKQEKLKTKQLKKAKKSN